MQYFLAFFSKNCESLTVLQLEKGLKAQTNFIINRWAKTADGA